MLPWQLNLRQLAVAMIILTQLLGAGTILQALRMRNKKLIVVVNMSLMDNHQYQLAQVMQSNNYAICSDIR